MAQSGSGGAAAGAPEAKAAVGSSGANAADVVAGAKLVRTASLEVQVDDVQARTADVRRIAVTAGGSVTSENSTAVPKGSSDGTVDPSGSQSSLTLDVPADTLDGVLDQLGKLGTTVLRTSSSKDVTSTYVDTQSRIATMKASLDQLRALLGRATAIDQIVALETELSRRQADLDSLQAQLASLDKKVAISTVSISLRTAATISLPGDDGGGFLGGLRNGWRAFVDTSRGVLTVLGAVLPFVAVVGILGGPVYVWRRRRREAAPAAHTATTPRTSAPAGSAPPSQAQEQELGERERETAGSAAGSGGGS